jgi:hypothetical protein
MDFFFQVQRMMSIFIRRKTHPARGNVNATQWKLWVRWMWSKRFT